MENRQIEPWEAYPDVWPTKAKFFSWLRGALRRAVWSHYPGRIKFKNAHCGSPPEGYTGRAKSGAYCSISGEWANKSSLEVDHIKGEASLKEWSDVESFVRHLCPTDDNMQLVTKNAHKVKTYAERMNITYAEAVIEKKVILFSKLPPIDQEKILTIEAEFTTIGSTSKKRVEQYRSYLYKKEEQ